MKRGGYIIVDFKGIVIDDSTGANIDGIYEKVKACVGGKKATLVSGLNNDGTLIEDFYTKFVKRSTDYYGMISFENSVATYVKIESDDDVSIVTEEVQSGGGDFEPTIIGLGATGSPTKTTDEYSYTYTKTGITALVEDVTSESVIYIRNAFRSMADGFTLGNQFGSNVVVTSGAGGAFGSVSFNAIARLKPLAGSTVTLVPVEVTIATDDAVTIKQLNVETLSAL